MFGIMIWQDSYDQLRVRLEFAWLIEKNLSPIEVGWN